ncbi:hypothetical protein CJ255_20855 [Candidatus Viridilinea mediisalina]|uniref:site-specific DNA-methyltransferase (adenine-specific) n=2 Tax=Candidatus Viridilinea mediisalina TaxID=2024553 RepID=A0A2A6RDU4_9CHLR|nr:hypothetical protein CJ255_20855 [Candidatus Viridilinea mediisalina]
MGAYYTRDDITDYICRNTIIPALCDKAGLTLAPLNLAQTVTHYLYPAMRQEAPLPTETERELAVRRARVSTIVAEAQAGNLATINDAVTANLDLEALLSDLIPQLEAPKLYALYAALAGDPERGTLPLSILDPTVGSGAFLFAALRILKPIYEALLERMEELASTGSPSDAVAELVEAKRRDPELFRANKTFAPSRLGVKEAMRFRKILAAAAAHPNRDYFITKSIVVHNLYGVDLMAEATEICKLRLLLRMVADRDDAGQIAPLPELDGNIRVGNALVGAIHSAELGLKHQAPEPFHWCNAFAEIIEAGGFDVIVGNPPYIAYRKVKQEYQVSGYQTEASGNLYAFVIERALNLLAKQGRFGMIVPIASVSTDGMKALQQLYQRYTQWHSHYAVRPGKLFAGVDMNLTITLLQHVRSQAKIYCTTYYRWFSGKHSDRPVLFEKLSYCPWAGISTHANPLPKLGSPQEVLLLEKMHAHGKKVKDFITAHGTPIYYHSGGRYWRKALLEQRSSHYKPIYVHEQLRPALFALLNSQLFYWYWISNSNCMDVVLREVLELPVFDLAKADMNVFSDLETKLLRDYANNQTKRTRRGEIINSDETTIDARKSKPILDEIDRMLAAHYGFTEEELDFIINYDIKYRMMMRHSQG